MSLFISSAYANDLLPAVGSGFSGIIPIVMIVGVFYFLLIRPQQKKMKQHETLIKSLRRGDKIVTGGGILGTITKVDEQADLFTVEIAEDVKIQVKRSSVPEVLNRTGSPSNDNGGSDKAEKKEKASKKPKATKDKKQA
ncbi:MAG: yajC [Rickettsiales bacterium]|jgi:preprotein translocase subunit YajC|nr:yajC [Rickettsiales bacterium]